MYKIVKIQQFDSNILKNGPKEGTIKIPKDGPKPYLCSCRECDYTEKLSPGTYEFKLIWWTHEYITIEVLVQKGWSGQYAPHEFEIYADDEDFGHCSITI